MFKTLKLSFALLNTYRVNATLFSLKQVPLLKKILPSSLYQVRWLKVLANCLTVLWEIITIFAGKFVYFITLVCGFTLIYTKATPGDVFLHVLLFLSLIGSRLNTKLFNPSKDKYYAIILMRMDAKAYTLINYAYELLKIILGFLPFTIYYGLQHGLALWICILLPFCIVGMKLFLTGLFLRKYEKNRQSYNENKQFKNVWIVVAVLLAVTYLLPLVGIVLPCQISMLGFLLFIPLGFFGLIKVLKFEDYRPINQELLADMASQLDSGAATRTIKQLNEDKISTDTSITSKRHGFEYLNELFIKRHQKMLWNSAKHISLAVTLIIVGALIVIYFYPESKPEINQLLIKSLPYMTFIIYSINRGTSFTQVLFMNCDHSLLTYAFYKRPDFILKLFQIRLRELIKINLMPAALIALGLAGLIYATGGSQSILEYLVVAITIISLSIFFSIHYLTIYYLLQPYNIGTEVKSGTYQIVLGVTYGVCFGLMYLRIPILVYGIASTAFCVIYSIIASILVYKYAPKTFRIRN